jgi:hypothetical protein
MLTQAIIYLGSQHMTAGIWRAGRLCQQGPEVKDFAALNDFLAQHRRTPIAILVDAADEDYRLETLPHTSGRTQQILLQRKLTQLYKTPTYFAAQLLARNNASAQAPDQVLCMGFTSALLNSCLDKLTALNRNITGIYLLATLQPCLLQQLKLSASHILLCLAYPSGVRLSYIQNGQLMFSRWLAGHENSTASRFWWQQEIEKTRAYLLAQKLIARNDKLELYGHGCDSPDIQNIDLSTWAKSLAIHPQQLHSAPQWLYMHLLAQHKKPVNFAPASLSLKHQLSHYRLGLYTFTSLLLTLSCGLSYAWYQDSKNIQANLRLTQRQMTQIQQTQLSKNPIAMQDLTLALQFKKFVDSRSVSPILSMQALSQALQAYPDIELQSLRWQQSSTVGAEAAANSYDTCLETSDVSAEITGSATQSPSRITQFLQQLRQQPDFWSVTLLPSPNTTQQTIKGSSSELQDRISMPARQKFSFQLVLKAH